METTTSRPKGQPMHEVCKNNVEKPTLIYKKGDKSGIEIFLQWFGEADSVDLSGMQFLFPVNTKALTFFFKPEKYELIMVAPINKWPNATNEAISHIAHEFGGHDVIVIYFISSEIGVDAEKGQVVPAGGMLPLSILLADPDCGIIKPQEFIDDSVRIKAIEKFQKRC